MAGGLGAGVQVRRARPEEIEACADLYVRVLRETFTWLPRERHQRDEFLRSTQDEEIYVAVEGGRILGLAGFFRPMNFLHSLYADVRGAGVGKALLDHVSAVAGGPVSLKVQEPNRRAQAFYAREGFVLVERGRDPGAEVCWLRLMRPKPAKCD